MHCMYCMVAYQGLAVAAGLGIPYADGVVLTSTIKPLMNANIHAANKQCMHTNMCTYTHSKNEYNQINTYL